MNIVIIEDERIAIRKLKKTIGEIDSEIQIVAELESVYDAKKWFQSHKLTEIDLVFSDIHLSDGLSFEIFENIDLEIPIVFTTAYDDYALRAFKLNGVDYLLKPIQKEELEKAISKFRQIKLRYAQNQLVDIKSLMIQFQQPKSSFPSFISYQKDRLLPLESEKIAFFYINNLIVYAVIENDKFVLGDTMDEIERRLPSQFFFRANRQFIVQKKFISNAEIYFNNRLIIHLNIKTPEEIIISREKVSTFKDWLIGV